MCNFYSFLTDEKGNKYAMGHDIRVKIRNGESNLREDSHASIAELWKVSEDKCNKFEFNPLTKKLTLDTQNLPFNDSELINIDELMKEVKEAVPELIIKPIVNPFIDRKFDGEITDEIIELVKEWDSIYDFVYDSVYDSVRASIRASIRDSVWDSVYDSVWNSVWNSLWDSGRDSVWDYVYAYILSFFNIKYNYDFSSAIKLWDMGLVPSFDGKMWRLNSYEGIIWKGEI